MSSFKTFETERLYLRPINRGDAAFIFELFNTPKWLQFIGNRNLQTIVDAKAYIVNKMLPQLERLGFSNNTVVRKADGAKICTCGLYDRAGVEGLDKGFALLPQYEKQGYAYEAANRILQFAVEDLKGAEVLGITSKDNYSSQKLLKKLGLKFTEEICLPGEEEKVLLSKF